jgi:hypothetical protein
MRDRPRALNEETRALIAELAEYGATIDYATLILLRVEALTEELDEHGVVSYDDTYDRWENLLQGVIHAALEVVEDDDEPLTANDLLRQWGIEDE